MRIAIESLIHEMESRLGGYVTLLIYRYANLCVTAQPMSLLPVVVEDEDQGEMNIEQVAGVKLLDDFRMEVVPYDPRFNFPLCKAIREQHPEFKQDLVRPDNASEEDERRLILTMPEVNKDRHDALIDSVNILYDGCKAQIDKTSGEYRIKLGQKIVTLLSDDERNEAKEAFGTSIKTHQDIIDTVKADKVKEIEDAYQHYLEVQAAKRAEADEKNAAHGQNAGQQLRMDNNE